jgi:putative heme transporter
MYVLGVSCIGAMEAVIVGGTALATGVNSWAVIAFAIFLGNYIPYVGGLVAGVFAVLLALGAAGPGPALAVLIAVVVSFVFAGPHIGVFFIGGALKMPVAGVFTLTMVGATVLGFFGAAAAAPVARLIIDANAIIKESRAHEAQAAAPSTAPDPQTVLDVHEPEPQVEG